MARDVLITPALGLIDFLDTSVSKATLTLGTDGILVLTGGSNPIVIETSTSGSSALRVDGTNGTIFEVVDDLSDSLMSVNTIAGLPVFEVFADNHIVAGRYGQNDFYLNTDGSLGLGTSSPSSVLDIYEQSGKDNKLRFHSSTTGSGTSNGSRIGLNGAELFINNIENSAIKIYTQSTQTNGITILGDGKVGIGTTLPDVKLHVSSGDIRIGNGNKVYLYESNSANYLAYNRWEVNTSTALAINNAGTGGFQIQDSGAPVLFVGTDSTYGGNVGIGTTSPSTKLHVLHSSSTVGVFESSTVNTFIGLKESGGTFNYIGNKGGVFTIQTPGSSYSDKLVVLSDGNVGIGTTDPTGKLQIGDDYTIDSSFGGDNIYIKGTTNTASYDPNVYSTNDIGVLITISDSDTVGPTKPGLVLYNDDVTAGGFSPMLLFSKRESGSSPFKATMAGIYARAPLGTGDSNSWIDGELIFATAGAASNGIKQRMVINKEGNVGIGTTDPDYNLHVSSASTSAAIGITGSGGSKDTWTITSSDSGGYGVLNFRDEDTSTTALTLRQDGYVGIGTTSPGGKLHVYGGTTAFTNLSDNTDSVQITRNTSVHSHPDAKLFIYDNSNSDYAQKISLDGYSYGLRIDGWVDYGLNIVHNTLGEILTTRSNELVINQAGSDYNFRVEGNTDQNLLFVDAGTDRVGIGTTGPVAPLHVSSNAVNIARFSGTGTAGTYIKLDESGTKAWVIGLNDGTTTLHIRENDYNGTARLSIGAAELVVNEDSGNYNFRVEGDGDANLIKTDASNDRVGIGTASPTQKLHVVGKALITDDVQLTGSNPRIDFNSNGASSLRFYDTTNAAERMRIDTSGKVGIGTSSPAAKLDVCGTDTVFSVNGTNGTLFSVVDDLSDSLMSVNDAAGLPVFEVFADNTIIGGRYNQNDFYLQGSSGNIGIGTASPTNAKLQVAGDIRIDQHALRIYQSTSVDNADAIKVYFDNGNPAFTHRFGNTTSLLEIASDGASSPEIAMSSSTLLGGFLSVKDSGGNYSLVAAAGKVGIGTAGPSQKLDVVGNSVISGSLGVGGSIATDRVLTINSVSSANRPAVKIVNPNVDTTTASNGRTFYGWLPIDLGGTTKWIPIYN